MKKNRTIFIGGLIEMITTKDIDAHFRQFGKIKNIVFKQNKIFDERRTFAYLVFQDKTSAENALKVDRHIIKGKRIDCQPAHGGKDKTKDVVLMMETKIHLKGLSAKVTSEDLQKYFIQFGEIRQAYVVLDAPQKKTKCFGFVQFYDLEITKKVLETIHCQYGKKIKCERFVPKDKKFQSSSDVNCDEEDQVQKSEEEPKFLGCQNETVADQIQKFSIPETNSVSNVYKKSLNETTKTWEFGSLLNGSDLAAFKQDGKYFLFC